MYGVMLYERFATSHGIQMRSNVNTPYTNPSSPTKLVTLLYQLTLRLDTNCKLWTHDVGLTFCTITVAKRHSASMSICRFSTYVAQWHSCHIDLTQLQWVSISSCCGHALKIHHTHISVRQFFPGHIPKLPSVEPLQT